MKLTSNLLQGLRDSLGHISPARSREGLGDLPIGQVFGVFVWRG
jgi:hypothetical protein